LSPLEDQLGTEDGRRPEEGLKPTILLVEDDEDVLRLLAIIIEEEGFVCEPASSAIEAELLLKNVFFEAAIIDKNLPDADGIELARYARDLQARIAVYVITGYPTEDSANKAAALGVDGYIVKPIDIAELRWILRGIPKRSAGVIFTFPDDGFEDEDRPTLIPSKMTRASKESVSSPERSPSLEQTWLENVEGLTVLLLEPDHEQQTRIREALESIRCQVTAFSPGEDLFGAFIESERHDVLVARADVLIEFAEWDSPRDRKRPFAWVAIAERRGVDSVIEAIQLGARGVLAPPFDNATVAAEFSRALSRILEETGRIRNKDE
jgi:DNA-binding response OmpR family regulator